MHTSGQVAAAVSPGVLDGEAGGGEEIGQHLFIEKVERTGNLT
jgi:hypothetical protein